MAILALSAIREMLPDSEPYRAWSNFEFVSNGRVYEVDLLLVLRSGVCLIELKDWGGPISGNAQSWRLPHGEQPNPLILANTKARLGGACGATQAVSFRRPARRPIPIHG